MHSNYLGKNSDARTKLPSQQTSTDLSSSRKRTLLQQVTDFQLHAQEMSQDLATLRRQAKDQKVHVQRIHTDVLGKLVAQRTNELKGKLREFTSGIRTNIDSQNLRTKNLSSRCKALQQYQRIFQLQLGAMQKRIGKLESALGY